MLKKNKQLSLSLSIIIVLGFVLSLGLILRSASLAKNTTLLSENGKMNSLLLMRLKIPSIKVDAPILSVGLTPDGAMDVPKGPTPLGWYMLGPKPGEVGNSVIDGHSGWKNGIPAVFDNLYKLKIGDKVYVENNIGVVATFVVREVRIYDPNADAYDVFVSNDGKSHLNLITCTGAWNKILKSHSSRLVVFADKE